jgi:catechol 2,3-dioxygenase-like lactoylglutathione lyase family enzyme
MADFNHMGLTVKDLAQSVRFSRDVVGMTPGMDFALENGGFAKLTNNPAAAIKVAHLQSGSFQLQLVEYTAGGGTALSPHHNNIGSPHLSFQVENVDAKFAEVQGKPYTRIISAIVEVVPGVRSFYVEDPDGVPVEFMQPKASRKASSP